MSARGDAPGFVRVLDSAISPFRIGRATPARRWKTCWPILRIGLLFIIPGIDELLRVQRHRA